MEPDRRAQNEALAEQASQKLADKGVVALAATWVDNSGITRVKAVPLAKIGHAAAWGIGASPVFDAFLSDDLIVAGRYAGGPVGDLRLYPDLSRLTVLAAQPGWAWAPADRYTQDGSVHSQDQRSAARRLVETLESAGLRARMAFEVEWAVGLRSDEFVPAVHGPAYGYTRIVEASDYLRDLLATFVEQDVDVDQIHPEYAAGQYEISIAAEDPVGAADTFVLVRETIRAVTARHGLRASFSPKVQAGGVGNGGHVHVSLWRGDQNLFAGGHEVYDMTAEAAAFAAGILHRLPALLAVGTSSVASYLRLIPQHWAGAFQAWGLENRETALRFITGSSGDQHRAANLEVKAFDESANPYLVVVGLIAAGLAGVSGGDTLPAPIEVDPASISADELAARGIRPLPTSLAQVADAFEADDALAAAFGKELAATIVDVRRAEHEKFASATPEEIAAAVRWRY